MTGSRSFLPLITYTSYETGTKCILLYIYPF